MRAQRRAQLRSRSDDRPRDIRTAFRPVPDIAALIPAALARTASLLRDAAGFNHVKLANRGTSTACAEGRSAFPDRTADPRVRA